MIGQEVSLLLLKPHSSNPTCSGYPREQTTTLQRCGEQFRWYSFSFVPWREGPKQEARYCTCCPCNERHRGASRAGAQVKQATLEEKCSVDEPLQRKLEQKRTIQHIFIDSAFILVAVTGGKVRGEAIGVPCRPFSYASSLQSPVPTSLSIGKAVAPVTAVLPVLPFLLHQSPPIFSPTRHHVHAPEGEAQTHT